MIGTAFIFVACCGFLFIPWPQPVWLIVADQVLMGASFGLLSTPVLVGVQDMVEWNQRGVVTGMISFTRNLGQSLGAAVFGAIFNHSFQSQMNRAPAGMAVEASDILKVVRSSEIAEVKKSFLEQTVSNATVSIFIGLTLFAVIIIWSAYKLPPKFEKVEMD